MAGLINTSSRMVGARSAIASRSLHVVQQLPAEPRRRATSLFGSGSAGCSEPYFDAAVTKQVLAQVDQASRSGADVAVLRYQAA